jgi:NOL1/NOP2/sun family putative RNA methylase
MKYPGWLEIVSQLGNYCESMSDLSPEHHFSAYRDIIPGFAAFCSKLREPLPVHLRLNTLKAPTGETCLRLRRHGVSFAPEEPGGLVLRAQNLTLPGHLPTFSLGYLHTQTLSSVLAGLALEPEPGELVLDLCAAPGGKTALLAQLMKNQGIIVANDKSVKRHIALRANLKRLGVTNAILARYPGQHFPKRYIFDRVLVDVPCSAEGTLRTDKNGKIRHTVPRGEKLPFLQAGLLIRGYDLLKPGGTLVYSTCTYNPDENESIVQNLLNSRPATIQPISLDVTHSPGLSKWKEVSYDSSMRHCWRIYPHQLDTVGFFLARVAKGERKE